MISRVAEHCFWLFRYLERAEATARLVQVARASAMDRDDAPSATWRPVLAATGDGSAFVRRYGAAARDDAVQVMAWLTWSPENPVSVLRSLGFARENARTVRDAISLEMWQVLNAFWLWLADGKGRALWERDRHAFYERVKLECGLLDGLATSTLLHDEPYAFMRLGGALERAGQSLRIVEGLAGRGGNALDAGRQIAMLRACSGLEGFLKRHDGAFTAGEAVRFLLQEPAFPRSAAHALGRAAYFLDVVRGPAPVVQGQPGPRSIGGRSASALGALREAVGLLEVDATLAGPGLAVPITALLAELDAVCEAVRVDFFAAALAAQGMPT
jgi:uncharacterized alpha-E superfamily protein